MTPSHHNSVQHLFLHEGPSGWNRGSLLNKVQEFAGERSASSPGLHEKTTRTCGVNCLFFSGHVSLISLILTSSCSLQSDRVSDGDSVCNLTQNVVLVLHIFSLFVFWLCVFSIMDISKCVCDRLCLPLLVTKHIVLLMLSCMSSHTSITSLQ